MGKNKAKQAKKLMKAEAKLAKKQANKNTRTTFLYNPWVIKIAGGIVTALILYFLLGKS